MGADARRLGSARLCDPGLRDGGVVAVTSWLWLVRAPFPLRAACLLVGSLLATPYLLDYDLVLLGPAIAFLVAYGREHGFRRWEVSALALAWFIPIATRAINFFGHVPGGLLAMAILFIWRRVARSGRRRARPASAVSRLQGGDAGLPA
jgi:hypothetical protein